MPDAAGTEDRYALAIDLGTTGLKVGLVSLTGAVAWTAGTDLRTHLSADGGAEQDPVQWWRLVREAARTALHSGTIRPSQVVAVSATGQWASTVPVAGDGTPVGPCILWWFFPMADLQVAGWRTNRFGTFSPSRPPRPRPSLLLTEGGAMAERVDAVVIGAGLGGLAAAAVLAGAGRKVVVLEQHSLPGGYAQGFQRGPYRFDASLHALNGLAPGGGVDAIYRELGIWNRVRLHRLDPLYRLRLPDREVVAHADWFRYESELIGHFPGQAAGIRAYLDEALAVYHDSRRMGEDQATGRMPPLEEMPAHYPSLVRASGQTWEQMMAHHLSDAHTRAALGALWGYVGLPPAQCSALVGAVLTGSYHEHGGWYPEGGAQALSTTLAQVLRERGGDIRYGQLATGVELDGERAVAVATSDGRRLEAEIFISNASAPATLLELVGRDRLPADYVTQVENPATSYTTFAVYLGLGRDVFAEPGLAHELFLAGSYDNGEEWQAAQRGDWDRASLSVTDYTRADPGCAPPGHAVVVLTTAAGWDYEDTWGTAGELAGYHQNPGYLKVKEQVADALIARAAGAVPGLADAIQYREASTPLTNHHYTRNPRGAIEGYENSPANSGLGWLPQQTPIRNLFLAGAWTNTGGMNPAMTSGLTAARLALRQEPAGAPA